MFLLGQFQTLSGFIIPLLKGSFMDFSEQKIGHRFQQETKYTRPSHSPKSSEKKAKTPPSRIISLPTPSLEAGPNFWEVLQKRRSIRDYTQDPLTLTELSSLLWATQGITEKAFSSWYRTAPSAGALHPIDTYLVVNRVERLDPGIYLLDVAGFSLETKKGETSLCRLRERRWNRRSPGQRPWSLCG